MATTLATTTFFFPRLKLKKADVKPLNFERICFQFLVGKNNECTLIGHKLKPNRVCKPGKTLLVLEKDNSLALTPLKLKGRVLFVQLELSVDQVERIVRETTLSPFLRFIPEKRTIGIYNYVVYRIITNVIGGPGSPTPEETSPCPPAIPPGSGGGSGD